MVSSSITSGEQLLISGVNLRESGVGLLSGPSFAESGVEDRRAAEDLVELGVEILLPTEDLLEPGVDIFLSTEDLLELVDAAFLSTDERLEFDSETLI